MSPFSLKEVTSTVRHSCGETACYTFFTTQFLNRNFFDGSHPVNEDMFVYSLKETHIGNGSIQYQVTRIISDSCDQ